MPHRRPSIIQLDPEAATVTKVERMLDLAEFVGLDPESLAFLGHRLGANGREREGMGLFSRRDDLDALIRGDLETLCETFNRMVRVVDRMPAA